MTNYEADSVISTTARGMTVQEAGRRGGNALVDKHGRSHMSAIGKLGGKKSPTKFVANSVETTRIATLGGQASGGNFKNNPERAREAGRKGGLTKQINARTRKVSTT